MSSNVTTVYTYQLNGVSQDFKIPFDYLSRKFVKVTLLGKDRKVLTFMTDYRFMSPTLIRTTKAWGPSDGYNYIEIRRETSARDLIVDFSDGSILRASDLNTANLQAMHIAEEARSLAADSLSVNDDGNLDARFRKIVNLGDPVGRRDAVTKAYVDDAEEGAVQARNKALQYRNEAQSFRNQTESIKNDTNTIKNQAISETNSIKNDALSFSNNSKSYANEAKAQIAKAQSLVDDVRDEGVIANRYAVSTIEHAKASAANAQAALISATDAQNNKVACAGHEAATAVYEQRAREVESTVVNAKNTAEQKAKEANLSATKSNESKVLAEKARAAAAESASQTNLYKDSAAQSAEAAARDAASAASSANSAIAQAASALDSASKAKTSETKAKEYSESVNPENLVHKSGATMTGKLTLPELTVTSTSNRNTTRLETRDNTHVEIVVDNTQYNGEKLFFKFRDPQGVGKDVCFPKSAYSDSGDIHLATKEETISKSGDTMTGEFFIKTTNYASVGLESTSVSKRWYVSNESGTLSFYRRKAPYAETEFVVNCPDRRGTLALAEETLPLYKVRGGDLNFDTTTKDGFYVITGSTTGTGAPAAIEGHMIVFNYTDGNIEQRVTAWKSGTTYVRSARYLPEASWEKYEIPRASSYSTLDLNEESDEGISLYKEVEDLKAQVDELKEMLLNVTN